MLTILDLGESIGDLSKIDMQEEVGWNIFLRLNFIYMLYIYIHTYGGKHGKVDNL